MFYARPTGAGRADLIAENLSARLPVAWWRLGYADFRGSTTSDVARSRVLGRQPPLGRRLGSWESVLRCWSGCGRGVSLVFGLAAPDVPGP